MSFVKQSLVLKDADTELVGHCGWSVLGKSVFRRPKVAVKSVKEWNKIFFLYLGCSLSRHFIWRKNTMTHVFDHHQWSVREKVWELLMQKTFMLFASVNLLLYIYTWNTSQLFNSWRISICSCGKTSKCFSPLALFVSISAACKYNVKTDGQTIQTRCRNQSCPKLGLSRYLNWPNSPNKKRLPKQTTHTHGVHAAAVPPLACCKTKSSLVLELGQHGGTIQRGSEKSLTEAIFFPLAWRKAYSSLWLLCILLPAEPPPRCVTAVDEEERGKKIIYRIINFVIVASLIWVMRTIMES